MCTITIFAEDWTKYFKMRVACPLCFELNNRNRLEKTDCATGCFYLCTLRLVVNGNLRLLLRYAYANLLLLFTSDYVSPVFACYRRRYEHVDRLDMCKQRKCGLVIVSYFCTIRYTCCVCYNCRRLP